MVGGGGAALGGKNYRANDDLNTAGVNNRLEQAKDEPVPPPAPVGGGDSSTSERVQESGSEVTGQEEVLSATYHSHLMEPPSVNQEERGGANRYR